jgi:protein TonB
VTLLVMIDEAGRVEGTSVVDAVPDGVFEQAAQQALANAAFYPAQKDGRTVRSRILIKVEFDPAAADTAQ